MSSKRMKKEDKENLAVLLEKASQRLGLYQYGDVLGRLPVRRLQEALLGHAEQLTRSRVEPSKKIYSEISYLLQETADAYSRPELREVGIIPSVTALRYAVADLKPYR